MRFFFARSRACFYVTLFVERSGSTYLASLLDSHPEILSKREEFAHLIQRGVDAQGQLRWAQEFWTAPWIGRHKAIGFKTKLVDILDLDGFRHLVGEKKVRIIQLQRQNLVKAVVSTLNAKRLHKKSGNWNLLDESDRLSGFEVDLQEFEHLLQERIRWDQELEEYTTSLKLPRLRLNYEDLLRDKDGFLQSVFGFVQVKEKHVEGRTLKNTSDDLREVILNFEELRGHYVDTPYHDMFTERIEK